MVKNLLFQIDLPSNDLYQKFKKFQSTIQHFQFEIFRSFHCFLGNSFRFLKNVFTPGSKTCINMRNEVAESGWKGSFQGLTLVWLCVNCAHALRICVCAIGWPGLARRGRFSSDALETLSMSKIMQFNPLLVHVRYYNNE